MADIEIKIGQSLADMCLEQTGTLENLAVIALVNNIGVTDDLVPGQTIVLPESVTIDTLTKNKLKNINIATWQEP